MTATAPRTDDRRFSGPRMVVIAIIAMGLTFPGQTASISVFLDPMIAELEISRTVLSTAYMIGTLAGAFALPWIGRMVDKYGTRRTMAVVGAAFSLALVGLSLATDVVGLGAAFVGIRMLGQGALGLCAATLVSRWYEKRRGLVLSVQTAVGGGIISASPVALERLIAATDWRTAVLVEAALIALIVIPMAAFFTRDRPADLGQFVDGDPANGAGSKAEWGMTRGQAMRQPFFWVLVAAFATAGFFTTAIGFHQIALLGERGLSATEAAANFLPQSVAGTAATLVLGYLVDRTSPRLLIAVAMLAYALGMIWGTVVEPGWSALGFGVMVGAAGNALRTVVNGATPRLFGTAHIGAIRGIIASVTIAGTAFAPVLYSLFYSWTGSFGPVLWLSTLVPLAVMAAALLAPMPRPEPEDAPETRLTT
ncbi:MFS transporter [Glycomyces halotolerans]